MYQYLLKYLVLHKNLAIPKLGVFSIEQLSAEIDSTNHLMYPPTQIIRFKQDIVLADKHFYDFLVRETGHDLVDVIKDLHAFTQQVLQEIQTITGSVLQGIGTLKKDNDELFLFIPERPLDYLFQQVSIDKSISLAVTISKDLNNEESTVLAGEALTEFLGQTNEAETSDNWWVYAIALLLLGAGALLFYYV
jgi:CCDC81-like prokaryotic HU domain 1